MLPVPNRVLSRFHITSSGYININQHLNLVMNILNFFCNRRKASKRKNSRYGSVSLTGYKNCNPESPWVNQDSFIIGHADKLLRNDDLNGDWKDNDDDDNDVDDSNITKVEAAAPNSNDHSKSDDFICAVFDGHGPNGHLVSAHCKDRIISILDDHNDQCAKKTFACLQHELEDKSYASSSGTTCTLMKISKDPSGSASIIQVCNVGDSQAFLGVRRSIHGKLEPVRLTMVHTPESEAEARRIKDSGGEVYSKLVYDEKNKVSLEGPLRVWYRCDKTNKVIGLAMTRSLGDCSAHRVGVSCEPDEVVRSISQDDEFIILCSDGVTDVMSPEEVTVMMDQYMSSLPPLQNRYEWDPQTAATMIVSQARKRWQRDCSHIDDVTCCVVKLRDAQDHYFLK